MSEEDRKAKIRTTLARLDTSVDTDWTQGGLPSMERMKELTGFEDLKRDEVGEASPGFHREAATVKDDAGDNDQDQVSDDGKRPEGETLDPASPYGGDVHTADQQDNRDAARLTEEMPGPDKIAARLTNPIVLIEAAMIAMNADDRYRKNGELQNFMRAYLISQVNIKAHQERLDRRHDDAERSRQKANAAS
jgi:hypothetical protein